MTSSAANDLTALLQLLEAEAELAGELRQVAQAKQRALVEGDLPQIQSLAASEQRLGSQLAAVERQRHLHAQQLAAALSGVRADHTLTELLGFMPDHELKPTVQERAENLRHELLALRILNEDNLHLTQNLLDYTRIVLRLAAQGAAPPAYTAAGQVTEGAPSRLMVDDRF